MIHLSLFPALNYTQDSFCVFTDCPNAHEHKNGSVKILVRRWCVCYCTDSLEQVKWEFCRGTEDVGDWCSFTLALAKGFKYQPEPYPHNFVELSELHRCKWVLFLPQVLAALVSLVQDVVFWGPHKVPKLTVIEPTLSMESSCFLSVFSHCIGKCI